MTSESSETRDNRASGRAVRRVTLRDVAEASGVSQSTVSFVLNEAPNQTISQATRERVTDAARELGYVPNGIARALMEGSSRIVVLNIPRAKEGNYSRNYIRALDKELALYGFVLLVRHGHATPGGVKQVLDVISPRAVINFGESYLSGHELEDSGGGWENGMAAHVLLQLGHLADRGHTVIALAFPAAEPLAEVRLQFANQAATRLGVPHVIAFVLPGNPDDASTVVAEFRACHPEVTAVAAFDDITALRLLGSMHELGVRVPEDLAVIGFDETEFSPLSIPKLTTVRAAAECHGRLAARRALGLDTTGIEIEMGQVIERETV